MMDSSGKSSKYPRNFLWGVALAAHQVEGEFEGGEGSDWARFERSRKDGKSPISDGSDATVAIDHWHRYAEDLELARGLGTNSIRTSVAWEKIEPVEGNFNPAAIEHYRGMLGKMRELGQTPILALSHFTHPQWFHESGGWLSKNGPEIFLRFCRHVVTELGDLCQLWVTFNEPMIVVSTGYLQALRPPEIASLQSAYEAAYSIARAHRMVTEMIHELQGVPSNTPGTELRGVGLANSFQLYDPRDPANPKDREAANALAELSNWAFVAGVLDGELRFPIPGELPFESFQRSLPPIKGPALDWLGVNYYGRYLMAYMPNYRLKVDWIVPDPKADNGWNVYPEGLERVLRQASARFGAGTGNGIPLVISETGVADATDRYRPDFIRQELRSLDSALAGGEQGGPLDVRGYFHWTLADNFEWEQGYSQKFGLYEVLRDQFLRRVPRGSAAVYRNEISRRT